MVVVLVVHFFFFSSIGELFVMTQPSHHLVDTCVWEIAGRPDSMDPAVDYESIGNWVLSNIYETLFTYPFDSNATEPLVPLLAAGPYSISPDERNYTFEVRQGITFHDGTPFNASCVKWNIERAMKIFAEWSAIGLLADVLQGGAQVKEVALSNGTDSSEFATTFDTWIATSGAIEIPDVYTVRFVLEKAFSPFITLLATEATYIMSPTYAVDHASDIAWATWENYGVDYGEFVNYMDSHTCGTGPYTLTNWIPDQYIELTIHSDYWRTAEKAPLISPPSYAGAIGKVFIRTNDDAHGRELNLRAGVVDGVYWPTIYALDIWDSETGESLDPNIDISTGGYEFATAFFGFNMSNLTIIVNSSDVSIESPFKNKHLRRGASFAFDYDRFIEEEYYGFGVQGKGPIPIGMAGHNSTSYEFKYNITAAVEEWNLAMLDSEFISSLNAMNCSFTLYYIEGGSSLRPLSMNLLQQGIEEVFWHPMANHTGLTHNITIAVEGLIFSDYMQYREERRLLMMDYGLIPDYADPISYLYPLCYSEGDLAQEIGYNDTDIDLWCDLAISEIDSLQRHIYFNQIQDAVADEAPYLWAYQQVEFRTWRNWTSGDGLIFNPMRDVYFYHIIKDFSLYTPPYPYLEAILAGAMFVIIIGYGTMNYYSSRTLLRNRIKLGFLAVYTGLGLYLTAWIIFFIMYWLILFPAPALIWVPWCFIYCDYMNDHDALKSAQPTVELQ
ncbi:MAG: ABC transporter substrate-binding protein [Candidatus Thorarchaeota archaeon]|nr:ABC transporter substrate-binding protein [Candidatus Thorarchaeota archaeon]